MTAIEPTIDSSESFRRFARDGSEESFASLMGEHLDHVYSVALRRVGGDSHLARDVTQLVFTDLARKIRERGMAISAFTPLSGWLHQHTCFVSAKMVRTECRRRTREEAAAMSVSNDDNTDWSQLTPVIDEAVEHLSKSDRTAILLRFYERRNLRDLGRVLGVSEDAAQKRVSRALDCLRNVLSDRGITSTAAALGAALGQQAVASAPSGLLPALCSSALSEAALPAVGSSATQLLGIGKLQPIGAGLVAVGLVATIVLQSLEKTRLKESVAVLERQIAAAGEVVPRLPDVDPAELAKLRKEHEELLRLRGEMAMLRNQATARSIADRQITAPTLSLQPFQQLAPDEVIITLAFGSGPGGPPPVGSKPIRSIAKVIGKALNPGELENLGTQSPLDTVKTLFWAALNDPRAFSALIANDSSMLGPWDKDVQAEKLRDGIVRAVTGSSEVLLELISDATFVPSGKTVSVVVTRPGASQQSGVSLTVKPVQDHWEVEQITSWERPTFTVPLPRNEGAGGRK